MNPTPGVPSATLPAAPKRPAPTDDESELSSEPNENEGPTWPKQKKKQKTTAAKKGRAAKPPPVPRNTRQSRQS